VKAALAGKRVKCPACGQAFTVADVQPASAQPDGELDLGQLAGVEEAAATTLVAPLSQGKKKEPPANTRLIVGLSAGAGGAVLLLLLALVLWPSGADDGQLAGRAETSGQEPAGPGEGTATRPAMADATRTYPSFPDAVTESPPWIGTEAPFDVAKFFETPPAEENAAPLYLDALFEFSRDMSICYTPSGQEPQGETKRRCEIVAKRDNEFVQFETAWQKNPGSLDNAAVDAWLAQYKAGFQKLEEAQKRPQCKFATGIGIAALLPHVQATRQVARVVKWQTRRDLARKDVERPVRDVGMVLRLSRDIQPRGAMVCQLVSVAMDHLCCDETVTQIVRADGIEKKHCDRLLAVLSEHEAGSKGRFPEAIRTEYIMARKPLHDFQHHTGDFSAQAMQDMGIRGPADSPLACLQLLIAHGTGGGGQLAWEKYGKGATGLTPDHPLVAGWAVDGKLMTDADYAKEVDAINRVYASILKGNGQTSTGRSSVSRDAAAMEPLRDTYIAFLFQPPNPEGVQQALLRADAVLRGTKCLIALRRWQLDHDGPPPDLESAVKAAGMPEVPTDPFCGQPLRMTNIGGEPVIYSVAMDGKDDQGRVDVWKSSQPGKLGDILFRLKAPQ
jgi:hypothetical protein